MQSLSKTPVSFAAARQVAVQRLGRDDLIDFQEMIDGYFNAAYRLTFAAGLNCVLKVAPLPGVRVLRYEQNILQTEVTALRLVKERTTVPVPAVLYADDSREILPTPYFVMEFIPGEALHKLRPTLPAEAQAQIDQQIGRCLRQMNQITSPSFGYPARPEERHSRWQIAFDRMLANLLQDGLEMDVRLPLDYPVLRRRLASHYAVLDEVATPSLVHWDLWDGNIFIDPDTLHITGIIDFERALWADHLMECNFGAFGLNPAFLEGYGLALPYTPAQARRRALYNTYLYLVMVIECSSRQYPTNDQETWARAQLERQLEEL